MKPRRGLPSEPEPFASDETELEQSAVRRGMWLDEEQEPRVPRRAARGTEQSSDPGSAGEQDEPDVAALDLQPSVPKAVAERSAPAAPPATMQPQPSAGSIAADPQRRRWMVTVVATALAGLALSFGIGAIPAQPAPLPDTVPLVTAISRTCPVTDIASSTLHAISSEGQIKLRKVGQQKTTSEQSPLALADQTTATVLAPDELQASVIGGSLVHVDEQAWWGPCHTSLADQYVLLPGGQGAKLIIINPEPDEALIDVTLSGPAGEITGDGLRGITIPANSQHEIDLGPLAGSLDAVGARVRSSVGRVLAVAQVSRDKGGDFATSTVQSTRLMVAAIPAGASKATLLLTNPGTSRNVVRIEALGEGGRFDLPGFESYAVDAQRTIAIDLTAAIEGAQLALVITARDELAASTAVTVGNDFGLEPGQVDDLSTARQELIGVIAGAGALQLANPSSGETLVVVDWGAGQAPANRTLPAGAVATIEVPAGARSARIEATAPIAAAVLLQGGGQPGFAIAPLQPAVRSQASMPMEADPGLGR